MASDGKKKETMDEALGTISAALAILEKMPELQDDNFALSVDIRPVDFLMQCLYKIVGYDKVVDWVTNCIGSALPTIETAVKTYILTQLKYIFDCTINPFITYDLIKYGVVFDLKTVDLVNMLQYCPLDKSVNNNKKNGKYYYFGCEEFDYPDQLENAEDFNALLWYMKNRTVGTRSVWYGHEEQKNASKHISLNQKQKKEDGIITLEYSGRPTGLKDAEGNSMTLQTPFNNCIHVFLGNTKPIESGNIQATTDDILVVKEKQGRLSDVRRDAVTNKEKLEKLIDDLKKENLSKDEWKSRKEKYNMYVSFMDTIIKTIDKNKKLSEGLQSLQEKRYISFNAESNQYTLYVEPTGNKIVIDRQTYYTSNNALVSDKKQLYDDVITQHTHDMYRPIKYNYYYHKTLLQFNIDYIFSLKLFDKKTVTARLLDALSGCITLGLDLSFEERMAQNMVRQAINDIIDNDDTVVSDCFFTFDNDIYNSMMERSESQRLGLMVAPNGYIGQAVNPDAILESLNELSPNASPEQVQSAIESAIFEVTRQCIPEYNPGNSPEFNADWRFNIVDNLIQTLAYVIVLTVLSPKIYLLIAVNLKIMGRESTFDLISFMDNFKQLISGIVKTIRDELMRMLKEWLMELIGNLAKEIGAKLALEQIMYYQELLRKCIACFQLRGGNTIGWNMQNVDYSDIYDTENNEPTNAEC